MSHFRYAQDIREPQPYDSTKIYCIRILLNLGKSYTELKRGEERRYVNLCAKLRKFVFNLPGIEPKVHRLSIASEIIEVDEAYKDKLIEILHTDGFDHVVLGYWEYHKFQDDPYKY